MKYVIKVNDIQDAIQQPIRPVVAKDLNNKLYVSTKKQSIMKTVFHYSDGSTSESTDTVITSSSYESQIPEGESLTGVEIGNNVKGIGNKAFYKCESLNSITIPNSVTSIGVDAFWCCSSLTSVTIPNSVTSIGNDAFFYCFSLTSVSIGNSVTSIGDYAFTNCRSLTSITIPNSVTSIGDYAFTNCVGLNFIICKATIPPTLNSATVFDNTNDYPIYVPLDSVDTYKGAPYWTEYADRILSIRQNVSDK